MTAGLLASGPSCCLQARHGAIPRGGYARTHAPFTSDAPAARFGLAVTHVDAALNRLADAAPGVKRRVVDAAAYAVSADGVVQADEAALLRAVCAALDVPLPVG